MDHDRGEHVENRLAENHKRIWLGPRCLTEDRFWGENDVGCCDECGEETVEYIRADIVSDMLSALKEAAELLNDHYSDIDRNGNANGALRLVAELRDVIAKAEG